MNITEHTIRECDVTHNSSNNLTLQVSTTPNVGVCNISSNSSTGTCDITGHEIEYWISNAIGTYGHIVVAVIGIPGNVAALFTILTMKPMTSFCIYVAVLAVADTVALSMKVASKELMRTGGFDTWGCRLNQVLVWTSVMFANWILIPMSIERAVVVWFPFRGRGFKKRQTGLILFGILITLLLLNIHFLWTYEVKFVNNNYEFPCRFSEEYTSFGLAWWWVNTIILLFIPCFLIVVSNFLLVSGIRKAQNTLKRLSVEVVKQQNEAGKQQRQLAVMSFLVSLMFIILNVPLSVFMLQMDNSGSGSVCRSYIEMQIMIILSDMNNGVNFYIYFLAGSQFRQRFCSIIFRRKQEVYRPSSQVNTELSEI